MPRLEFPLVDLLPGFPSTGPRLGAPVLSTHGTVIELFAELACTTPADARNLADTAAVTSVTVQGVTLPGFLGPASGAAILYGRPAGATGNGFPIRALNAADAGLAGKLSTTVGGFVPLSAVASLTMVVVEKDPVTGFWPTGYTADGLPIYTGGSASTGVRPHDRPFTVIWKGPDPAPPIVSSGTGGMRNPHDMRAKP